MYYRAEKTFGEPAGLSAPLSPASDHYRLRRDFLIISYLLPLLHTKS